MPATANSLLLSTVGQLALPAARTTTFTGTGLDCLDYDGRGVITLHSAKGTGNADNTLIGTIEESDASGSGYAAVSGMTFATVLGTGGVDVLEDIVVDFTIRKRYLRFIGTIAGTTPSFVFGVSLRAMKKYR